LQWEIKHVQCDPNNYFQKSFSNKGEVMKLAEKYELYRNPYLIELLCIRKEQNSQRNETLYKFVFQFFKKTLNDLLTEGILFTFFQKLTIT